MQQSNVIFAYLFIAYFLFITLKGELPTYITLLRGGGTIPATAGGNGSSSNAVVDGANALLSNNPFSAPVNIGNVNQDFGVLGTNLPGTSGDWLSQLSGG